jgi:hypothetical protein
MAFETKQSGHHFTLFAAPALSQMDQHDAAIKKFWRAGKSGRRDYSA